MSGGTMIEILWQIRSFRSLAAFAGGLLTIV